VAFADLPFPPAAAWAVLEPALLFLGYDSPVAALRSLACRSILEEFHNGQFRLTAAPASDAAELQSRALPTSAAEGIRDRAAEHWIQALSALREDFVDGPGSDRRALAAFDASRAHYRRLFDSAMRPPSPDVAALPRRWFVDSGEVLEAPPLPLAPRFMATLARAATGHPLLPGRLTRHAHLALLGRLKQAAAGRGDALAEAECGVALAELALDSIDPSGRGGGGGSASGGGLESARAAKGEAESAERLLQPLKDAVPLAWARSLVAIGAALAAMDCAGPARRKQEEALRVFRGAGDAMGEAQAAAWLAEATLKGAASCSDDLQAAALEDAVSLARAAVAVLEAKLGPTHLASVGAYHTAASALGARRVRTGAVGGGDALPSSTTTTATTTTATTRTRTREAGDDWDEAAMFARRALDVARLCCGDGHPMAARAALRSSRLLALVGRTEDALRMATAAAAALDAHANRRRAESGPDQRDPDQRDLDAAAADAQREADQYRRKSRRPTRVGR
jgi:hypothetical protein